MYYPVTYIVAGVRRQILLKNLLAMSNFDEQSDQDVISFIRNTELASFDSIDTDPASPLDLVLPNNAKERASLTGAAPLVFADDVSAEHKVTSA